MDRNSNVYKNYIVFKKLIEDTQANGYDLNDILDGIKKLEVVEIILDKLQGDDPQKIFESINSTGLELSLADLIRNYLLMDDENQDKLYEDYWLEIEGNVGYRNLDDFVINYLNSEIISTVNKKNAYRLFKEYCQRKNLSHRQVLTALRQTSRHYGAFIGEIKCYSDSVTKYLDAFRAIKQTTVLPFLFKIFDDFVEEHIDEDVLCKVLDYLLTYLIRRNTCEATKNLAKFMKSLYSRVIDGNYEDFYKNFIVFLNDVRANDRMPTDEEFTDALKYRPLYKKSVCRYMLSVIENPTNEHIDVSNLTVEHILPQKENAVVWKKALGDDYNRIYETYLHTLGNLTITGLNSELGTKSFEEKKRIIKKNSKANILNKDVLSAKAWNEDSILRRAKVLSEILKNRFEYVKLHSRSGERDQLMFDVNSTTNFKNTKPVAMVFLGEHSRVTSWADLLDKTINTIYDLSDEIIKDLAINNYSIPNGSRVYISNDKRVLRKPRQIANSGVYYEINLSANNIISFIKDLLVRMQLDMDNFSFALAEAPFDINNEATWAKGFITVAQLFYNFVEDLIKNNRITTSELENLKSSEYTKKKLRTIRNFPAIATNRTDNMVGKSGTKRYREKPVTLNGIDYYVSKEFYDSDRDKIIDWYKKHL